MSFYEREKKASALDLVGKVTDLQRGDGEETIWFRSPNFAERQRIFASRVKAVKNEDTGEMENKLDIQASGDVLFQAEVVSTMLVTSKKKQVGSLDEVKTWEPSLVDKLYILAMEALAEMNANSAENPSPESQT